MMPLKSDDAEARLIRKALLAVAGIETGLLVLAFAAGFLVAGWWL